MLTWSRFSALLDGILDNILSSIPKRFSSAQFISAVKSACPTECGELISHSNIRTLHVWLSRWYLSRVNGIERLGETQVVSVNGNKSSNALWENNR